MIFVGLSCILTYVSFYVKIIYLGDFSSERLSQESFCGAISKLPVAGCDGAALRRQRSSNGEMEEVRRSSGTRPLLDVALPEAEGMGRITQTGLVSGWPNGTKNGIGFLCVTMELSVLASG